jgi:D-alanyl-D-alanine carboxypeptidase (penicillin-binding protein 5/6)
MNNLLKIFILIVCFLPSALFAQTPISTSAEQMILIDLNTQTIMAEKNADERIFPASLTKLMTSYILFQHISQEFVNLHDTVLVSKNAWQMKGSRSFLEVGKTASIETLLKGLIVQSGNDAAVAIAEGIAGSEDQFSFLMNDNAAALGMNNTHFLNASGWPHLNHYSTVRDMSILASDLIRNFPSFYSYYSIPAYTHNKITQKNRNPLLSLNIGVDGLKTGFTEESGYALVASAQRKGRRILLILSGLKSKTERKREGARIIRAAFSEWLHINAYQPGDKIVEIPVLGGIEENVYATTEKSATFLIPRVLRTKVKLQLVYDLPLSAPITLGQKVGEIQLHQPGADTKIIPLVSSQNIPSSGILSRISDNLRFILFGNTSS